MQLLAQTSTAPRLAGKLSPVLVEQVQFAIRGEHRGVMLYGSCARGDAGPESDIDILQIVSRRSEPYKTGQIAVTAYTEGQLRQLATAGSLFILHLREEGIILSDPENLLRNILDTYVAPRPELIAQDVALASAILDTTPEQLNANLRGLTRVAVFLLRTLAYTKCLERGRAVFSLREVSRILRDDRLEAVLREREYRQNDASYFEKVRALLGEHVGGLRRNSFGSIEAFAVNVASRSKFASALAVRACQRGAVMDYATLIDDWMLGGG